MKPKPVSVRVKVVKSTLIDGVEYARGSEVLMDMEQAQALTAEMPDRLAISAQATTTEPEEDESEDV